VVGRFSVFHRPLHNIELPISVFRAVNPDIESIRPALSTGEIDRCDPQSDICSHQISVSLGRDSAAAHEPTLYHRQRPDRAQTAIRKRRAARPAGRRHDSLDPSQGCSACIECIECSDLTARSRSTLTRASERTARFFWRAHGAWPDAPGRDRTHAPRGAAQRSVVTRPDGPVRRRSRRFRRGEPGRRGSAASIDLQP
jgi:hypothetical protein